MLEKQTCVHVHMYKTKRGAPVREEVEGYTITIGIPYHGMQSKRDKETSIVSHNFNFHQCGQHAWKRPYENIVQKP